MCLTYIRSSYILYSFFLLLQHIFNYIVCEGGESIYTSFDIHIHSHMCHIDIVQIYAQENYVIDYNKCYY